MEKNPAYIVSLLKKLAGQTMVYGLTTILGRFISYMLTPLHTSGVLSIAEYGTLTNIYAYAAFLNVIYTYGLETAYFRFATKTENAGQKPFNNAFSSIFFSSVLFSGIIWYFAVPIADLLSIRQYAGVLRWVALILATDALVAIPFAKLRLLNKVYLFAAAKISNIMANFLLNFVFLIAFPFVIEHRIAEFIHPFIHTVYGYWNPLECVFAANFLANLVYLPFLLPVVRGIRFTIDPKLWKEMFIYAFPIFLMGIPGMINEMFSRIMIERWLPQNFYEGKTSMEALGIFGASYKLSVFMTLATQAFKYASEPFFFSNSRDKNAPQLFAKVMHYYVIVTAAIFLLVCINMELIAAVFIGHESFREAIHIVPVLLMANLFFGIYFNLSVWYKLTDRTYWGTYITLGGAIITVVLNYYLIPVLGYEGSVLATFVCYLAMAFTSYLIGQRYFPVPYSVFRIFSYLICSIAALFAYYTLGEPSVNKQVVANLLVLVFMFVGFGIEKFTTKNS